MHPQLETCIQKVDDFMAAYPTISQYDRLSEVEKKTGYPKAYFFTAGATLLTLLISAIGGMKLISDLIGFVYPAYMSFKAIESSETADDTQWLTYWVVFAKLSIIESAAPFLVEWIPFYYAIKILFFSWLFHPKFMGAVVLYKQFKPTLSQYLKVVEKEKPQKKEE
eukprot:CCRYP_014098-RA/>CCRYP_014098-RA protein AED:0.27 eAED:0.27 QI:137/1/1/1/0.66/0.5/4/1058/165